MNSVKSKNIVRSLSAFLHERLADSVEIVYPGFRINTSSRDEWIELSLPALNENLTHQSGSQLCELSVELRCFVKASNDKSRLYDLADQCRDAVRHQLVFIRDHDRIGTPAIGYVRLFEPQVVLNQQTESLFHSVNSALVSCRGIAQQAEISTAA